MSITGATASIYRSQRLVLSGEEETKGTFKVPDSCLVECGTVSTGRVTFGRGIFSHLQDRTVEE